MSEVPAYREKIGFALGGFGNALVQQSVVFFYLIYLTDTVGLAAATTGLLFLLGRFFDAVTDPFIGYLIDRWHPGKQYGRLQFWLLIGAPLLSGTLILLFAVPETPASLVLVWIYVTYLLAGVAFDFGSMSYTALMPTMTQDSHQRSVLSSLRIIGAGIAILVLAFSVGGLDRYLSGGRTAWLSYMVVIAMVALIALVGCALTVKERTLPVPQSRPGLKKAWRVLLHNRPLHIVLVITLGGTAGFAVSGASWIYYFQYVAGRPDLFGTATLVGILSTFIGVWLGTLTARYSSKKRAIALGLMVSILSRVWLYFIPAENLWLIFANRFLQDVGFGIATAIIFSMLADTVEYAQWQTGLRAEGLISAAYTFVTKLAAGIGGALISTVLHLSGYIPNTEQLPLALAGITITVSLLPAGCLLLSVLALPLYNLSEERYQYILTHLQSSGGPD